MWKGEKKYLKTIFHPIYSLMFFPQYKKKAQKNKNWTTCKFFKGVLWDEMGKEDEKLYWKASNNQHEQNP